MAFLDASELRRLGLKHCGNNVKISNKASIYMPELMEIGDNSRIDDFCVISGRVRLGRNVHIAVHCNVAGGEPGVFFGDFSGAAYNCQIFSQSDDYSGMHLTNPTVPDAYKKETKAPISIGRHVILGTSSIVLPGVNISDGCSVGAMSMVTKSTEPWGIYFGIPAKRIRERRQNLLALERDYLSRDGL